MRSRVTPLGAGGAALTKSNEREPAQLGFSTAAPHSQTFTVRTVDRHPPGLTSGAIIANISPVIPSPRK
jgi:hypothetical protein